MDKVGSLKEYLISRYGVDTRPGVNPITDAVAITATRVLTDNPRRLSVLIMNVGANPIYIGRDNTVSSSKGIYLAAGGGAITLQPDQDFNSVASERWAIAVGGVSTIYIEENVII